MWGSPAARGLVSAALALAGCGDEGDDTSASGTTGGPQAPCAAGTTPLDDGRCQPAGLPLDLPCPPGETPHEGTCCAAGSLGIPGGACQGAGVPADGCGAGFASDGDDGCVAILPERICDDGQLAVPGERACHDVAPCGGGTWGDIPVESDTQYVDIAYAGGDGDGTSVKPWTTVQAAVDAAADGAIVAIAQGTYGEHVQIAKPVRLWGRCPAMVTLEGFETDLATVRVGPGGDGAELRDLAVIGTSVGVIVYGAGAVVLDRVWLHDLGDCGLTVWDLMGPAEATISRSLVERARESGVYAYGGAATVQASVIRGTLANVAGQFGRGVASQLDGDTGARGEIVVTGSVVERVFHTGIFVGGSTATIDSTVVRWAPQDTFGSRGISLQALGPPRSRSSATIVGSIVERALDLGIHVSGSDATVERSVVRDTRPNGNIGGRGINVQADDDPPAPASVTVRSSLLQDNQQDGVFSAGADVDLRATIVRRTLPLGGLGGRGIELTIHPVTNQAGNAAIAGCVVDDNHDVGLLAAGGVITLDATIVRNTRADDEGAGRGVVLEGALEGSAIRGCVIENNVQLGVLARKARLVVETSVVRGTQPDTRGSFGRGLSFLASPEGGTFATVRSSLVEDNAEIGVAVVESEVAIETSWIRGTKSRPDGLFGDGIVVAPGIVDAGATITSTLVETSARAGVSNFGGWIALGGDALSCDTIDLVGQDVGFWLQRFEDLGRNVCGCGVAETCQVVQADLAAPEPIDR